jgi:hypothetical protein
MTTLIPIDRATVRVNPHSGQSAFYIARNPVVIEVKVFLRDMTAGYEKNGQAQASKTGSLSTRFCPGAMNAILLKSPSIGLPR